MTPDPGQSAATSPRYAIRDAVPLKILVLFALVYLFILSITLLGGSFKLLGGGFAQAIFRTTSHPIVGLVIGVVVTAIIQSSSTTTSLIVGLVASGVLSFENAIPMVMGANIGTTITNTIVSLASISRKEEFQRAYTASTVHDFFNICAVIVLLPLQLWFNIIGAVARWAEQFFEQFGGMTFASPLAVITKPVAGGIMHLTGDTGWLCVAIAFLLLFIALRYIVVVLKSMVLARVERFFQRYIFRTAALSLLLGIVLTSIIQSSSITTSIIIPLVAAGVISVQQIYPYLLGANIGTTVTAFLASFVTGSPEAVAVAFAHLIFNLFGMAIFWPLKVVPLFLASKLGAAAARSKMIPIVYILIVFFLIPGVIILLTR
ncbi:MAG TPA: Na/Pi symporter [Acidobacteriota bacterium]|nr:Na/Pi symporter [Acidobacteriota bacterium]